tara:strand:- start:581 stop:1102 length:522 start_codon:yes stop_codon:yes gene_type:complete
MLINRLLKNLNTNLNEAANNAVTQNVSYWVGKRRQSPARKREANDIIKQRLNELSTYKQLSKRSKTLANSSVFTTNLTEHQEYLKLLKQYRNKILDIRNEYKTANLNAGIKKLKQLNTIENKITANKYKNKRKPPIQLIRKDLYNLTSKMYRKYINQIPQKEWVKFVNQRHLH